MKWHRSDKSALFDAFVDGQQRRELVLTYMYGISGLLENLHGRVAAAVQAASQFWAKGDTPHKVYAIVNELRSKPGSDLYTQLPIANAFCLARSGREAEGRIELERIIQNMCRDATMAPNDRTIAKVWAAFEDAKAG